MPIGTKHRLEGLLLNSKRGLVPQIYNSGVWALDRDRHPSMKAAIPREYDMICLLREDRLATEFGKLRRKAKTLSFAAPFWGLGAATTLGLKAGDEVRSAL